MNQYWISLIYGSFLMYHQDVSVNVPMYNLIVCNMLISKLKENSLLVITYYRITVGHTEIMNIK